MARCSAQSGISSQLLSSSRRGTKALKYGKEAPEDSAEGDRIQASPASSLFIVSLFHAAQLPTPTYIFMSIVLTHL